MKYCIILVFLFLAGCASFSSTLDLVDTAGSNGCELKAVHQDSKRKVVDINCK